MDPPSVGTGPDDGDRGDVAMKLKPERVVKGGIDRVGLADGSSSVVAAGGCVPTTASGAIVVAARGGSRSRKAVQQIRKHALRRATMSFAAAGR